MKRLLLFIAGSFLTPNLSLHAGTVAHWRFEGNGNSEVNNEVLSADIAGRLSDSEVPGAELIVNGRALENRQSLVSGKEDAAPVGAVQASDLLNEVFAFGSFSVEAFVKLDEGAGNAKHMRVIGSSIDGKQGGWFMGVSKGKLTFGAHQGLLKSAVNLASQESLSENRWHHVAIVGYRDSNVLRLRLFIDGAESEVEKPYNCYAEGSGGPAIVPSLQPILIAFKNPVQGYLDEIRISDSALEPEDFLKVVKNSP